MILTDEQCEEFRRMPLSFNDMVREIYKAGRESMTSEILESAYKKITELQPSANLSAKDMPKD